jgi:hypothetical protein
MKKQNLILSALLAIGIFATVMVGCKKDDEVTSITLSTLTAGGVDLNGATSATGVPVDANIVATFSTDVDAGTANTSTITLVREYDNSNVPITVSTSGKTVTIDPVDPLGDGTLYELTVGAIKSSGGLAFSSTTRTFTTAGFFAPSGAIAAWNFDDNADDIITGAYSATSVTAITYATGRNATAGKAASFDGSTSLIQVPNAATLENSSNFSLSFWIYGDTLGHTNASGGLKGNFVMGAGFFRGMEIEMGAKFDYAKLGASYAVTGAATPTLTNDFFFNGDGMSKDNGGWQGIVYEKDLTSSGGITGLIQGKWAHVVVTYEAATGLRNMYMNGELMETDDFTLWPAGDPFTSATGLMFEPGATDLGPNFVFGFASDPSTTFWADTDFGNYANPDANHFKGMLDDVRIYHQVLTQDEISLMYNSGK